MKLYTIEKPVTLASGVLQLTEEQAKLRSSKLQSLGGDLYQILAKVQFKGGETFGYDGDLTKLVQCVEVSDSEAEEKPALTEEEPQQEEPSYEEDSEVLTVRELSATLENQTIKETLELLKGKYGCKLKAGADIVPIQIIEKIVIDFDLLEDAEDEQEDED